MNVVGGIGYTRGEILLLVLRLSFITGVGFFSMKWLMNHLDPTTNTKKKAKKKAKEQMRKLADNMPYPKDIKVSWENIAGLEHIIQELKDTVILPIQRQELLEDSQLMRPPKGVLLHGPPGCGKTMIAKATAKEAKTSFINLDVSILTDKWYGESQKLTAAVFSLAAKLQPCIIFIDEIDSFLRTRNMQDHEVTAMMKAQFMSLWDGLIGDPFCTVIIMGATNRPQDIDRAILRRMPATFHIDLPNMMQRHQVLQLILQNEPLAKDINFVDLAEMTEGFSASDLQELCRNASVYRIKDYIHNHDMNSAEPSANSVDNEESCINLRAITMEDFLTSHKKMKTLKLHTDVLGVGKSDVY
ncbi:hypothetical protein KM043_001626 [Ampulex compressa]|nr:hypothetical protein KM043_001626 [Ampulex compressa]